MSKTLHDNTLFMVHHLTMHAMQSGTGTVQGQHNPLQPLPEEPPFYSSSGNDPAVHSSVQS